MSVYPYRVRRLRTILSVAADNERDVLMERDHRLCIWRVSDTEFVVQYYLPHDMPAMASINTRAALRPVVNLHVSQVRDWHLYQPGEAIPWPEVTAPPELVDSAEKMIDAVAKPNGSKAAATAKPARA